MKARRHEMHTLETPEASERRRAKEHVEFEPAREQARYKTREVQEHQDTRDARARLARGT